MHNCPLLAPKQTSARIDFLRQGERLVGKKGTHNVKIITKSYTKRLYFIHARVGNGTENTCACYHQCERLQGMLPTANGGNIMKNAEVIYAIDS